MQPSVVIPEKLFKEYDIRGEVEFFTTNVCRKLGRVIGYYFSKRGFEKIYVGYDMRKSSRKIFENLAEGLREYLEVVDIGESTTPFVKFVCTLNESPGIMITASHIPEKYNGIKIFGSDGIDVKIEEIKNIINENISQKNERKPCKKEDYVEDYTRAMKKCIGNVNFDEKILLYIGRGIRRIFENVFSEFGLSFKIYEDNNFLDPTRNNDYAIFEKVEEKVGFLFDGDADRSSLVLDKKRVFSEKLFVLFMSYLAKEKDVVVTEVTMSKLVEEYAKKLRVILIRWRTGRVNQIRKMIELNARFFGEYSYHYGFKDYTPLKNGLPVDDGILTALLVLKLGKSYEDLKEFLSQIRDVYVEYININLPENVNKYEVYAKIKEKFAKKFNIIELFNDIFEVNLPYGRIMVRVAGTENKIRILVDAVNEKKKLEMKDEIVMNILRELSLDIYT